MTGIANYDAVRAQIRPYLGQYLGRFGVNPAGKKLFRCINPSHQDTKPSCNIAPSGQYVYCFSCGYTGDIFDVANLKENKPLTGRGFVTDNLLYLGKMFGITVPEMNLNDEELRLIDARRAYAHASRIVTHAKRSEAVSAKLAQYGWPEEVIQTIGIGTVVSYDDFQNQMLALGHKAEFLTEIGLRHSPDKNKSNAARGIFQPDHLIYTIRDEHGSPIAFSARNLKFEEQRDAYKARLAEIDASDLSLAQREAERDKLFVPRKYINSSDSILFQKRCVLFNFDQARKSTTKTLIVNEGNADATTLFAGGLKMAVATCGTAFTADHLKLALAAGIKKIVIVFDPDKSGKEGTARFVKLLEEFGGHPGLEVAIIAMPGTSDPDAYVRVFGDLKTGVAEFRKLPQIDLFAWKLREEVQEGADPYDVASRTLPLIVNTEDNISRLKKADQLASSTDLPRDLIRRELNRLLDANEMHLEEQLTAIAAQTAKALQQNPRAIDSILATAQSRRENLVEASQQRYDPQRQLTKFDAAVTTMTEATDEFELKTGDPIFDSLMSGIPKRGVMMSAPGKPHHGKSIWIDNLIVKLLRNNSDLQILLHHVDDGLELRLPRILGVMSGISSRKIQKAGAHLEGVDGARFGEQFQKAQAQVREWIAEERLILADQETLVADLPAHERFIREIRRRNSRTHMLAIGDNFHLFDMPGMEPGEQMTRAMSKFISALPVRNGITSLFSMELPKESFKPGMRPSYTQSKGTAGIAFDSKVNLNVYQEMQEIEDSQLVWHSPDYMKMVATPSGKPVYQLDNLPVLELIIDKNKVTGEKRTIFYKLEPHSGQMEECSEKMQAEYAEILRNSKKEREAANKKESTTRRRLPKKGTE